MTGHEAFNLMSPQRPKRFQKAVKRGTDILVGAVMLAVSLPITLPCAIAVKADSPGPILFRQPRLGKDGKIFSIMKFRSMEDGAAKRGDGLLTLEGDPRVTRVGALLRRTRIDELPQLLNVLQGEMSIVGPRPTLPFHYDYYEDWEKVRVSVRPGMTGWTQVNGGNSRDWDERIKMDVWYVQNWNLVLDFRVLVLTVKEVAANVLGLRNTYVTERGGGWTREIAANPYTHSVGVS